MLFPIGPSKPESQPEKPKGYIYRQGATAFTAPAFSSSELMALRAHIDEAGTDPDYSVVVSYECRWDDDYVWIV